MIIIIEKFCIVFCVGFCVVGVEFGFNLINFGGIMFLW